MLQVILVVGYQNSLAVSLSVKVSDIAYLLKLMYVTGCWLYGWEGANYGSYKQTTGTRWCCIKVIVWIINHCPAEPGNVPFWKHCRSRSPGLWENSIKYRMRLYWYRPFKLIAKNSCFILKIDYGGIKSRLNRVHTGLKSTWIYRAVLKSPWK